MNQAVTDAIDRRYGPLPVYQSLRAAVRKLIRPGAAPGLRPAEYFYLCFYMVDHLLATPSLRARSQFVDDQWDELAHRLTTDRGLTAEEKDVSRLVGAIYMGAAQLLVRSGTSLLCEAQELINQLPPHDTNTPDMRTCFAEAFSARHEQAGRWLAQYVESGGRITDEIADMIDEEAKRKNSAKETNVKINFNDCTIENLNPSYSYYTTMDRPNNTFNNYGGNYYNQGATISQQTVYTAGNDMKQQVNASVASPLATPQAMAIWQKTAKRGWTDTEGHILNPNLISQPKAALLANLIAEKLTLAPRWSPFEALWGIKDLANKFSKAFDNKYKANFEDEVRKIID